ncbi:MAG: hypothetical protein H7A21_08310 [Spirochaetales bacterium]|nr:hypothetical protein [Leptospiraceae bacterium]MCP5481418.1 hypothetical protein [Spirochaetales bacterium]MCP5486038.1 hypothetical protein [Spirochaetales bacterium]
MFLIILFILSGLYMLLMAIGLVQRRFLAGVRTESRANVRMALFVFGFGLLLLGTFNAYLYLGLRPEIQRIQNEQSREASPAP